MSKLLTENGRRKSTEHLGFKNLKKEYVELFKKVVEMASEYFKDRKKI